MSKIGKKNIEIPKDSSIKIEGSNLTISGPKGTKKLTINDKIFSSKLIESKFKIEPFRTTFTFSGIEIFILPIFDIKIPYRLSLHRLFVF